MVLQQEQMLNEKNDFALDTLRNWVIITAQAFQDEVGLDKGIVLLDPYSKNSGIAVNNNWKRLIPGLEGLDGIAKIFHLTMKYMGIDVRTYVTDHGYYLSCLDCVYKNGPQIMCLMHGQQCADHMIENMGLKLRSNLLKTMTVGDDSCLMCITSDRDPLTVLDSPNTKELVFDPFPQDERRRLYRLWAADLWEYFITAYYDRFGSEHCMKVLKPKFIESGYRDIGGMIGRPNWVKDDTSAKELMEVMMSQFNIEALVTGDGPGETGFEVISCPFSRTRVEMCDLIHCYFEGGLRNLDGRHEIRCERKMTDGAGKCLFLLRSQSKRRKEGTSIDDVIMQLKMRLAKGEISKREYEELFDLLNR